jgi:hypothetical protein
MLFDVFFFGFPLAIGTCLGICGFRDQELKFFRPAFCFAAYCGFYLCGGREVLLYLVCMLMIGGGWASCAPEAPMGM